MSSSPLMSARRASLPDGRWHFQHGPIDIVIGAHGAPLALAQAHQAAWSRFTQVLEELVAELPLLRQPLPLTRLAANGISPLRGAIARRMWAACAPYHAGFITPMAAVAGSVAQELMACYDRPGVDRAWVNNGGDIALHLAPGTSVRVGLFADLGRIQEAVADLSRGEALQGTDAQWEIAYASPVRGMATSGWRGRSFSLGIADSVTVLAATAAQADAAATVVANAVNVVHPAVVRRPACELRDDSDLGALRVTVDVPRLPSAAVRDALQAGLNSALALQRAGLIQDCILVCQGQWRQTGRGQVNAAALLPSAPVLELA